MNNEKKTDNVVGIGHNNTYSKEQYAKLINNLHRAWNHTRGILSEVEYLFDEAFTKYPNSQSWDKKLKDFEVHERRAMAKKISSEFNKESQIHVEAIEKKAKANGIELELLKQDEVDNDQ